MSTDFTFTYDATTGVLIAAALRKAANLDELEASRLERMNQPGSDQARNRAKLFEDAAEAIHNPVRAAVAEDMAKALRKAGIVE